MKLNLFNLKTVGAKLLWGKKWSIRDKGIKIKKQKIKSTAGFCLKKKNKNKKTQVMGEP